MNIKPFSTQFRECNKEGFCKETIFKSFKDNPDFLPRFPKKKLFNAIKSGKMKGIEIIQCGRFNNGKCSSANKECRKLRGYDD